MNPVFKNLIFELQFQVTALFIVPPIALFLAKHPLVEKYDLSSLRLCFSAAAALGQEVMDQAKKRLGFDDFRQCTFIIY